MRSNVPKLLLIAGLVGVTACVTNPPRREVVVERVYVGGPPPAEAVEVVPTQPTPDHVWIRGFYRWDGPGRGYNWVPGHWQVHPVGYSRWEPGRWRQHTDGRWFWVEGRWRA